jgi:hypothetical protein|tara:strand:+ start:60 stop:215 length:156 start_codon:yes stop_codon:yes gene_type:complete
MTEYNAHCNRCGYETRHNDINGCVYHQMTLTTADGEQYQRYDEFNQDGEEW